TFDELKKKKMIAESLDKECIRLATQVDSLSKDVGSFDPSAHETAKATLRSLLEDRSKILSEIKSFDEKLLAASKEAGALESKLKFTIQSTTRADSMQKELHLLFGGSTLDSLTTEQKLLEHKTLSLDSERKSLERELVELSELIEKLRPGISECPLCASKITSVEHIKKDRESAIKQKKAKLTETTTLCSQAKTLLADLVAKIRKISLLSDSIANVMRDLSDPVSLTLTKQSLDSLITSLSSNRQTLTAKNDELSKEIDRVRLTVTTSEILLKKKIDLEALQKKFLESDQKRKTIDFDPLSFDRTQNAVTELQIVSERLISEKKSLENEVKLSNDILLIVRSELSKLNELNSALKKLASLEEELLIYKNALLETQTSLRESLVAAINSAMTELWLIFYPYKNYLGLRLAVTDKDYLFEVHDGRDWKLLESIASGGERATAALTLRVALAMVLTPNLSWLILDEPTHNLDSQGVELLSNALQFKVPEVVKQTFVITHEEALMGSDFASSYRLIRDKENNGETKVERI
ncbi:hypothetical protein HZC07_00005, partial [Candidatus Micrarchaeota archaeon]|nr:hypothetical protein [Candidatus Micrarchaeota archaeon]